MNDHKHATDRETTEIVFDHLVFLTDQVRRLGEMLEEQGLRVPDDLGTLGPCPEDAFERLIAQATETYLNRRRSP